jgi:hypothetical protein
MKRVTDDQGSPFTNGRAEINGFPAVLRDFRIEVEPMDVSGLSRFVPDPAWSFTDAQHHFHATSLEDDQPWPTLVRLTKGDGFDDDGRETFVAWSECKICGEQVEPNMIEIDGGNWRRYEPGDVTWSAEVLTPFALELGGGDMVSFRAKIQAKTEVFGVATVNQRTGHQLSLIGVGKIGRRSTA